MPGDDTQSGDASRILTDGEKERLRNFFWTITFHPDQMEAITEAVKAVMEVSKQEIYIKVSEIKDELTKDMSERNRVVHQRLDDALEVINKNRRPKCSQITTSKTNT